MIESMHSSRRPAACDPGAKAGAASSFHHGRFVALADLCASKSSPMWYELFAGHIDRTQVSPATANDGRSPSKRDVTLTHVAATSAAHTPRLEFGADRWPDPAQMGADPTESGAGVTQSGRCVVRFVRISRLNSCPPLE